jgi:phage-related minor tail protein
MGKSKEYRDAIMKEADAQKTATNSALDYADAKARSFNTGVQSAMKDYIENTANAANQAKTLFTDAFKGMEDAMVNFVKTGKLDFSSLADSIVNDLVRIAVQRQIMAPLVNGLGGLFGFADGGVMTSAGAMPLNKYANGGIATSPQMAIFGEGKTPEAFVPLPDGRNIPVKMQGGGGGGNVTVNVVNNAGGAKATTQERQGADGSRIIDVMIEQVKASIAADISRGTGTVTSALERTYGANRAAGAF